MDRKDQIKRARRVKQSQVAASQRAFEALLEEFQPQAEEVLTTR